MLEKHSLEVIHFDDSGHLDFAASGEDGSQWASLEEARTAAKSSFTVCTVVGWVIDETDDYVLVSNLHGGMDPAYETVYGLIFKVPVSVIKHRKVLVAGADWIARGLLPEPEETP